MNINSKFSPVTRKFWQCLPMNGEALNSVLCSQEVSEIETKFTLRFNQLFQKTESSFFNILDIII